jgi:hypothetical protein
MRAQARQQLEALVAAPGVDVAALAALVHMHRQSQAPDQQAELAGLEAELQVGLTACTATPGPHNLLEEGWLPAACLLAGHPCDDCTWPAGTAARRQQ